MSQKNSQNISDRKLSLSERLLLGAIPLVVLTYQRLVGVTSRRVNVGIEKVEKLREAGSSWIYAIWHTNVLFSPYLNRGQNVAVIVSASRDGEFIARVVEKLGNYAVRGSSSRGGISALKDMIRQLKKGNPAAFTPDGPRGPAFKLQHGIIVAAQRSGVPIVPFHYECTRQWVAEKSWDRHRIPKPFTTFVVSYGDPIYIPTQLSSEDYERTVIEVEAALLSNLRSCEQKALELRQKK